MARLYLTRLATGTSPLSRTLPPSTLVQTDFDWETRWNAACERDDLQGERDAAEDPSDLRSTLTEPDNLADFEEDDGFLHLHSPLSTAPSSPTPSSSSLSMQPSDYFSEIIVPSPYNPAQHITTPTSPPSTTTPPAMTTSTKDIGKKRKRTSASKEASRKRRDRKKAKQRQEREVDDWPPVHGEAYVRRYLQPDVAMRDFDVLELKAVKGGDTGKNQRRKAGEQGVPRSLVEADARGYAYYHWLGDRTTQIQCRTSKISVVCVGNPKDDPNQREDKTWKSTIEQFADHMEKTRTKYQDVLSPKDCKNRRGQYTAVNVGITRGSGSKKVHNLTHKKEYRPMIEELLDHPATKRVVAFQNEALAAHFPKVYGRLKDTVEIIRKDQPDLKMNFPSHSIYTGCTFNMGPVTVTDDHLDPGNHPAIPCAVTSGGPYDPDAGGFLVLEDLKLVIRFPPGATILLSSASIRHANIPVQEGDRRYSVTQFCPGGLLRWVRHGCRPACTLSKAERSALDGNPVQRWRELWDLLSTPESLEADRRYLVEKERQWSLNRRVTSPV